MNELLAQVIDAHGGMNRWNRYEKVEATIVSGGGLFPLKGVVHDANPSRMTVWLHEERSSVFPYGAADQRTMFTPERIAIEKLDGSVVAERRDARDSFAGHQMNTAWDALHRADFIGEALWTYLTTPFLLAMDGVAVASEARRRPTRLSLSRRERDFSQRFCYPGVAASVEALRLTPPFHRWVCSSCRRARLTDAVDLSVLDCP